MEPECSLPHSQVPANCPYPKRYTNSRITINTPIHITGPIRVTMRLKDRNV